MVNIEFEYEIHEEIVILGIHDEGYPITGIVVGYFVGSQGLQYLVDYFDKNARKMSTYFHPFQIARIRK